MPQPQLEGYIDNRDSTIRTLRDRVFELERQTSELQSAIMTANEENGNYSNAITSLRRQLEPLYRSLQAVFGDIELVSTISDPSEPISSAVHHSKGVDEQERKLALWKAKLPPREGNFLQLLHDHGEMNVAQMKVAARCGQDSVYQGMAKLTALKLVSKNGKFYTLNKL